MIIMTWTGERMAVNKKHHDIFIKRVKRGMTYSSIAKEYNVSRQCIFATIKRLEKIDYLHKLDTVDFENMKDLILPLRVITFLKKKGYYEKPITYFLATITKDQLISCTNLSVKSLMELLNVLKQTKYENFLADFRDIIEELRQEIRHV